jgi:hypothetical protein
MQDEWLIYRFAGFALEARGYLGANADSIADLNTSHLRADLGCNTRYLEIVN